MIQQSTPEFNATLAELGITRDEADKYMELGNIPWDEVEAILEEIQRDECEWPSTEEILRRYRKRQRRPSGGAKTKLASLSSDLESGGWDPGLTPESYERIIAAGFRGKNLALAAVVTEIALDENPITLRGLLYRAVSAGWLPSTDQKHYNRTGRILTTLRERGVVPFDWIVDNLRSTIKPSSWSGIGDFVETVRNAYRMDFWSRLPHYVHIFCEKDAIAGTLAPVTREYDVPLSPVRGYCSLSFAHEIADVWNRIGKPIFAYYLGDFDPSGFDLERDLRAKLERYCNRTWDGPEWSSRTVRWERLGVLTEDFEDFNLIPLPVKKGDAKKKGDTRAAGFIEQHGEQCAELDALPATELRRRVREAIEQHIPQEEWERLQEVERLEKETFDKAIVKLTT